MPTLTLTFDNGPAPGVTDQVLDTLAERRLAATFFVVGEQLESPGARELALRAHSEGHWIGNHTMSHSTPFGDADDPGYLEREVDGTQELLGPLSHPDRLFRPFGRGGVLDERLLSAAAVDRLVAGEYSVVLWNSVPRDWEDVAGWPDRAMADIERNDWTVLVVHDLPTGAMDHLPRFLDRVLDDGITITQELPDACVPVRRGDVTGDLSPFLRHDGS